MHSAHKMAFFFTTYSIPATIQATTALPQNAQLQPCPNNNPRHPATIPSPRPPPQHLQVHPSLTHQHPPSSQHSPLLILYLFFSYTIFILSYIE